MTEQVQTKKGLTPEKLKMFRDLVISARGGDPEAQSMLKDILKVEHIQEKTNFPTAINQQKQTYLKMCEDYFEDPNFPEIASVFNTHSEWDALTWRSYKKALLEAQTEMLKKGTDLSGLIMQPQLTAQPQQQEKKRFWQRNKGEGEQLEP